MSPSSSAKSESLSDGFDFSSHLLGHHHKLDHSIEDLVLACSSHVHSGYFAATSFNYPKRKLDIHFYDVASPDRTYGL